MWEQLAKHQVRKCAFWVRLKADTKPHRHHLLVWDLSDVPLQVFSPLKMGQKQTLSHRAIVGTCQIMSGT